MIANRATLTFGYGFVSVLLGIYLTLLGGSPAIVVASLGISLMTGAVLNILVGFFGDRFGRRRVMALFGRTMTASGVLLATYLARMAISQGDVPNRPASIAEIVAKEERTAANTVTNTARNIAQSAGPFSSVAVIAAVGSLEVPFLIGGRAEDRLRRRNLRVVPEGEARGGPSGG